MELLLWQKVLIAIYHEQNKTRPRMGKVLKGSIFDVRQADLNKCLIHLCQNERYTSEMLGPLVRLTREGREYVERLCGINEHDSPDDKNNKVLTFAKSNWPGWISALKDVMEIIDKFK